MEESNKQKSKSDDQECGRQLLGCLHKITKLAAWREGVQILKKEEEDVRLLDRCEAKREEWAKHWQCDEKRAKLGRASHGKMKN